MADRTHLEDIDLPARNQADPARSLFISYASHDAAVAEKVCSAMEAAGFPCWMAPRDVKPGAQYADAIVAAINAAKALVLVLSASAVASAHVGREVERAASKHKPMIAFRIDNAALSRALEYFLSESQWIDVSAMGMPAALARLAEAVGQGSATPAQALSVGERPVGAMTKRTRLIVVGVAVFVVGVLVALTLQYWRSNHAHTQASPAAAILNRSIAVLPFVDLSEGKNQSYFSDGLSEEVIGRLTQIPQLRVIARTSSFAFAGSPASAADIGRQLNVTNLLEGSVRRSADRVRVSAQLVRVSDSTNLWSATYERKLTDVLAMQDEIANAVVAALQVNLDHGGQSLVAARYVPKPDAYDEYLRGRQLMRLRPDQYAERAVEAFSKAVSLDHQYAAARSMLAFALSWVAENVPDPAARRPLMERALAAAEQAVALGPSEPDVFSTRGYLRFEVRRDLAGAEADFQKAMQLDPNGVPTLTKYSDFLAKMGRSEEALALTHRIKSTDPFFPPPLGNRESDPGRPR